MAALALGANGARTTAARRPTSCSSTTRSASPRAATSRSRASAPAQTSEFKVTKVDGRPLALVKAEVTEPGLADLRRDALCEIRPQSLIGEYFVDCQPGTSASACRTAAASRSKRTRSTIAIDLVNDVMRRPYRERLRLIVGELGAGLAGRPEDLSNVLRRAHPALRETSETLQILGRQTDTIKRFIGDANTVVGELEDRKRDVSRFVREAGRTAEISASRRDELGESFGRLPAFLAELEPYMGRLGDLTEAQTPVLRDLQSASGELDTFLTRLRPVHRGGNARLRGARRDVGRRAAAPCERRRPRSGSSAVSPRTRRASRSRSASSSRRSTTASAPWSPTGAPPPRARPPATRRTRPRAGPASPAWRRSGTTSTGRRSRRTRWTTSATSCGSASS